MVIPKKIKLASRVIPVKYIPDMAFSEDAVGMACLNRLEIHLQKPTSSQPIPPQAVEENFIHEVMHHIFYIANMDFEKENEENIINRITPYLHQFIKQVT